jgi:hypothetical protein
MNGSLLGLSFSPGDAGSSPARDKAVLKMSVLTPSFSDDSIVNAAESNSAAW